MITEGNMARLMPPWADALSDQQRWDVAYYLYTLGTPPEVIDEGRTLYETYLASLYGSDGSQIGFDDLSTVAEYSPQQIYDQFVAGAEVELTDDQRWAVVAYMQTFGYEASLEAVAQRPSETSATVEPPAEDTEDPSEPPTAAEPAPSPEAGVVQGALIPGTPGMQVPAGLEVRLRGLMVDSTNQVVEFLSQATPTDSEGRFRFEGLPFDLEQAAYVAEVLYQGALFSAGQVIDPANPSMDLPLTIYQTITNPSVVQVDAMHLVFSQHPNALLVIQVVVFSNLSDSAFVTENPISGGQRGSVAISLPPDAYNVTFEEGQLGGRFVPLADKIYDTDPLLPGQRSHSIVVTYFLPFDGPRDVEIPILYQTRQVTLLADESERIRSAQLNSAGTEVIQNTAYNKYLSTALAAGDILKLRVSAGGASGRLAPILLASAAGVLLVGGGVYWIVQRRTSGPAPRVVGLTPRQEALAREIVQLDEAFEAGRINRFEYEARRADLKATLAEEMESRDE